MSASTRPTASRAAEHFEHLYAQQVDPWDYETSAYEQGKYGDARVLAPGELPVGAGDRLLDRRPDHAAGDTARPAAGGRLCADGPGARPGALPPAAVGDLPADDAARIPAGPFDLTLLSEVGHHWLWADLHLARARIIEGLAPGGQLLLVHWTPPIDDAPLTGDEVHEEFLHRGDDLLRHLGGERAETYRLDLFECRSGQGRSRCRRATSARRSRVAASIGWSGPVGSKGRRPATAHRAFDLAEGLCHPQLRAKPGCRDLQSLRQRGQRCRTRASPHPALAPKFAERPALGHPCHERRGDSTQSGIRAT